MSQSHALDNNKIKFNNPLDNIQGNKKKKKEDVLNSEYVSWVKQVK